MTSHCLTRVAAVGVLVAALVPSEVRGQDQPVVFVHGLNSGPDAWREAAGRLQARLAIEPHRFQTSSRKSFGDQANELQGQYPAAAMPPVAVAHSNGGLVSRHWSRQRSLHGIVTIGTPHTGAPLVRNSVALARYYFQGYSLVQSAVFALAPKFDEWDYVGFPAIGAAVGVTRFTSSGLAALAVSLGVDWTIPVLSEMAPGSAFLTELNSDANLTRERLNVPHRIGIVSFHPLSHLGGPLRLRGHTTGNVASAIIFGIALSLDYWGTRILSSAVFDPADPAAYYRALDRGFALLRLARWTWDFEPAWCSAITSTTSRFECELSDVLVPAQRQMYPGASQIVLPFGPVHTDETTDSDDALLRALQGEIEISSRIGGQ